MCKSSIFFILFPCLYNFTQSKFWQDPDPVKIFQIRICIPGEKCIFFVGISQIFLGKSCIFWGIGMLLLLLLLRQCSHCYLIIIHITSTSPCFSQKRYYTYQPTAQNARHSAMPPFEFEVPKSKLLSVSSIAELTIPL